MASFSDLHINWISGATAAILLYVAGTIAYRLTLSPLAKFPGPKLAAATLLYEFYYDVIKQGQYTFKIIELHKKYGPIIRISPSMLHIDDPDYYEELYSRTSPRDKYEYFTRAFSVPNSTFSTIDHRHHRLRRQTLNPFFSKQGILRLEPTISVMVEKLCHRINEFKLSGLPLPMRRAYQCLATDVVTIYCFNKSWGYLDDPDFSPEWVATIEAISRMTNFMKHVPWLFGVVEALPDMVVSSLSSGMMLLRNYHKNLVTYIKQIIDEKEGKIEKTGELDKTIFHALLDSNLPPEDKDVDRLKQEGQVIVGAGADTTGNTLTATTFHLLDNPDKLAKLQTELEKAMPDINEPAKLSVVEQLPYLSAVILEGLRLSYGISTRAPRIAPDETLHFQEWSIPPGTPVGMTSVLMHHNETIFPDSFKFNPERWADLPDSGRALERYLVSFSKGTRQCVGLNLAKAELYLTLATVFRRYNMELYDTVRERDVDLKVDGFLPYPSNESKGVRVIFK